MWSAQLTAAQLDDLAERVEAFADDIDDQSAGHRGPWWTRGPDYQAAFDADSPFRGRENPWSPALQFEPRSNHGDVTTSVGVRMVAHATLDTMCAGPPNAVHGGVLAGLFDELIGATASQAEPHAFTVTGRLNVRYRQPTPLETPLTFVAEVHSAGSRSMKIAATCTANEEITASAEALMVVRR